jgi:hypothetical protein
MECFFKELGKEEERGSLVESVSFVVDQAAASAGEVILLKDCD